MKLVTRDTDYAVRALVFMCRHKEEKVSVSRLVKELKIPRPFLRKILQMLNKKGILISTKGPSGGFSLGVGTDRMSLIDVMEIFQGPFNLNECLFKKKACPNRSFCRLGLRIRGLEKYVFQNLKSVNIGSLK